jgi:hypothetical protein
MSKYETYAVEIAGLKRELRLFEIKPGLKIAILNKHPGRHRTGAGLCETTCE